MDKEKICYDYYNEPLSLNDFVFPLTEKSATPENSGYINNITFNNDDCLITLVNSDGKVIAKDVSSRNYSTKNRIIIRQNSLYSYYLEFYDASLKPFTILPLTKETSILYDIPKETVFVALYSHHYVTEQKGKNLKENLNDYLYYGVLDKEINISFDNNNPKPFVSSPKAIFGKSIGENYKIFDNEHDFHLFIKGIIKYFNDADLTKINNDIVYDQNPDKQEFEKNLLSYIDNNLKI